MTAPAGTRFCVHCDFPIRGEAERVEPIEAGSGVHADEYRHPGCGPHTARRSSPVYR
jgi:hypothetical protein